MSTLNEKLEREQHIIKAVTEMVREALGEKIELVEAAAAEAAEDGEGDKDKPVIAKLSLALKWKAGEHRPVITMKASHSVKRVTEYSAEAGKEQTKLEGVE